MTTHDETTLSADEQTAALHCERSLVPRLRSAAAGHRRPAPRFTLEDVEAVQRLASFVVSRRGSTVEDF